MMIRGYFFLLLLALSAPALAQGSIKIPEPTDIALFGLAVAGLIVGRRSSKVPPHDDNNDA
jgi:hypothetical protein